MTRFFLLTALCATLSTASFASNSMLPGRDSVPIAKARLGFDIGWESPYSAGMELSVTFANAVDVNGGFGLGLSGFKATIGSRVYLMPQAKWSPMLTGHLFRSSGFGDVTINSNGEEAVYNVQPATGLVVNAGVRGKTKGNDYFLISLGRALALDGGRAVYVSGSTSQNLRRTADVMEVGGFSLNLAFLIRLGK